MSKTTKNRNNPEPKKSKKVRNEVEHKPTKVSRPIKKEAASDESRTVSRLKKKIVIWMSHDNKIKTLQNQIKELREAKKQQEETIMEIINKLEIDDLKIDIHDDKYDMHGRVYKYKSVTKQPIKDKIIRDALMETLRDEKYVNQIIKKIDSKRPIKESYYLKRTKGNQKN
jgi:hypothetical protein